MFGLIDRFEFVTDGFQFLSHGRFASGCFVLNEGLQPLWGIGALDKNFGMGNPPFAGADYV
jgi:hypothetical protein